RFYAAVQNLATSFANHPFCVICAFAEDGYRKHPNHEPAIWEAADAIPGMEVAIVQATRACEGILGKPGKKRPERVDAWWRERLELEPNGLFELAGASYIEYYRALFGVRGDAAHNLGRFQYALSRDLTMRAQGFAWEVVR